MLLALAGAATLSRVVTGSFVPTEPGASLVFQSGLLLVVLGSALIEQYFTRPAEAAVNSLAAFVSLMTVFSVAPRSSWLLVSAYVLTVLGLALTCVVASEGAHVSGTRQRLAEWTYTPATYFGRARLIHSVVFLYGVFTFYDTGSRDAAILVAFWGVFVVVWPLKIPGLLSRIATGEHKRVGPSSGEVVRREWPDLMRVRLEPAALWQEDEPYVGRDGDGSCWAVVPLYKSSRTEHPLATGLSVALPAGQVPEQLAPGHLYTPDEAGVVLPPVSEMLNADDGSRLVGFVIEQSTIGRIRFETWRDDLCREGRLVTAAVGDSAVAYQITQGATREESLDSDRLGSQVAEAIQLGVLRDHQGILPHGWLPTVNTPVLLASSAFGSSHVPPDEDMVYGTVPGTQRRVTGDFMAALPYHTAILGVTGSGKTETAFRLVRHCLERDTKVVCIDLTSQYEPRLDDLEPTSLSLSRERSEELGQALFDVETGAYGAGAEKKVLKDHKSALYEDIVERLRAFLSTEEGSGLGLITLPEISNTQATLLITELYMSALLNLGRDEPDLFDQVLVVVEEAHTVMPETSTMGLGDFTSKAMVAKIAQIALQGRKYGVGLLVLAQRTATVTKTVLTQCNTVIAFSCFDETSRSFLAGVFGEEYADALRDLGPLEAVVFGKGVRSQRPIIVQTPYNPELDPTGEYEPLVRV